MTATRVAMLCLEWPSTSRHVGGVGRYAYRLAGWLSSRLAVSVVTGPDPKPMPGVELHPVADSLFEHQFKRYYLAPFGAAREILMLAPDVILSHGDDVALACRRGGPPIIRTFFGRAAAEARSGRWQRRANHAILAAIEHGVRPQVARAVGIGPDSARAYRADAVIPPVLPEDLPPSVGESSAEPTIVFIGGFNGRKRGRLAADVVERVRSSHKGTRFVVFGPEPDRTLYPRWVHFRSGASDLDVRAALAEAWVLLAPSTYEGFGIPAWEAMGAGAVAVGTPNPGMTFLAQNRSAIVVKEVELESTIGALLLDDDYRSAVRLRGRHRAEAVAKLADPSRYLQLIAELA